MRAFATRLVCAPVAAAMTLSLHAPPAVADGTGRQPVELAMKDACFEEGDCPTTAKQHHKRYKNDKMGTTENVSFTKKGKKRIKRQLESIGVIVSATAAERAASAQARKASDYEGPTYDSFEAWKKAFNKKSECMGNVLSYEGDNTMPSCESDPEKVAQGKVIIACGVTVLVGIAFKGGGTTALAATGAPLVLCTWKEIEKAW